MRVGGLGLEAELEVPAGHCLALAGPSGAGKTTVLRTLAGTVRPHRGRIRCGDELWCDTSRGVHWPPERRRCGYVFQDYALFPHLSAWRNVAYGIRTGPRRQRRAQALALLDRFGLGDHAEDRPVSLSGGERQRVAVARALAGGPRALLLDEPLSALDSTTRRRAARELGSVLSDVGVPAILVTHDFHEAALLGDEVGVIDGGRIVQRGSASELAAAPASAFVADFTGAVVLTGSAHRAASGLTVVELDGGGTVTATAAASGRVAASVYPWEITLIRAAETSGESAQNHLPTEVASLTTIGNRVRVGLAAPQPLVAEITSVAARELELAVGVSVLATWKATATRLVPA